MMDFKVYAGVCDIVKSTHFVVTSGVSWRKWKDLRRRSYSWASFGHFIVPEYILS